MYKYAQFWCFKCKINDNVKRNVEVRVFEYNGMITSKYCYRCAEFRKCSVLKTSNENFYCESSILDFRNFCGTLRKDVIKPNKKLLGLTEEENL